MVNTYGLGPRRGLATKTATVLSDSGPNPRQVGFCHHQPGLSPSQVNLIPTQPKKSGSMPMTATYRCRHDGAVRIATQTTRRALSFGEPHPVGFCFGGLAACDQSPCCVTPLWRLRLRRIRGRRPFPCRLFPPALCRHDVRLSRRGAPNQDVLAGEARAFESAWHVSRAVGACAGIRPLYNSNGTPADHPAAPMPENPFYWCRSSRPRDVMMRATLRSTRRLSPIIQISDAQRVKGPAYVAN